MAFSLSAYLGELLSTQQPMTVIVSNFAFLLLLCLLWNLTSKLVDSNASNEVWENRLIALLGGLCGWIVGMFFAPYTDAEAKHFAGISSTVSVFLSGYVVSKLDRFLEGVLFPEKNISSNGWKKMGFFCSAVLLVSVTMFTNRLYAFHMAPAENNGKPSLTKAEQPATPPP